MKKKEAGLSLSFTSDVIMAEVEHHFEENTLLPSEELIDAKVQISKEKRPMEFIMEEDGGRVCITCGGTTMKIFKSDFLRELSRFFARTTVKLP